MDPAGLHSAHRLHLPAPAGPAQLAHHKLSPGLPSGPGCAEGPWLPPAARSGSRQGHAVSQQLG